MKKFTLAASIATLSLASLGVAGTAFAAHHETRGPDANGDRSITRAEAQTHADAMFARMDANQDGKIDAADRAARQAEHFAMRDTNKDGALSREEFSAGANHGARAEGAEGPHRMARGGGRKGGRMMLRMADANKDQSISRSEFAAAHLKRFEMADANKDGTLTREERQAAKANMRAHQGHRSGEHDMPSPAS
jgi:Ca2+-binding EF-hand superfamily protein